MILLSRRFLADPDPRNRIPYTIHLIRIATDVGAFIITFRAFLQERKIEIGCLIFYKFAVSPLGWAIYVC